MGVVVVISSVEAGVMVVNAADGVVWMAMVMVYYFENNNCEWENKNGGKHFVSFLTKSCVFSPYIVGSRLSDMKKKIFKFHIPHHLVKNLLLFLFRLDLVDPHIIVA